MHAARAAAKGSKASTEGDQGCVSPELDQRTTHLGNAHAAVVEACSPRSQDQAANIPVIKKMRLEYRRAWRRSCQKRCCAGEHEREYPKFGYATLPASSKVGRCSSGGDAGDNISLGGHRATLEKLNGRAHDTNNSANPQSTTHRRRRPLAD